MELFHVIDDGVVILRARGVYKQVKLYRRGEQLYALFGGGFIRLLQGRGTTVPNVSWIDMEGPGCLMSRVGPVYVPDS